MGSTGIAPLILKLGIRWRGMVNIMLPAALPPEKKFRYPPNTGLGEAPKLMCKIWRGKKYHPPTWIRSLYRPARGLVIILSYLGSCRKYPS